LAEGFQLLFNENAGTGNAFADDASVHRTLFFPSMSRYINNYQVEVVLAWRSSWIEFVVPAQFNILRQRPNKFIPIQNVTTSENFLPAFDNTGFFCHACIQGGFRWGDSCWGVLPSTDFNRGCGCNSGKAVGNGIYYGGFKQSNICKGMGGGFAGPTLTGSRKGNRTSTGLEFYIKRL
jgi:hypothetical protein